MINQRVNLPNGGARRLPPVQRVAATASHPPMVYKIHPDQVWPTLKAENRKNRELQNRVTELQRNLDHFEMKASNATKQLEEAEKRNRELQGELQQWRSGAIKLACHCDGVDLNVFEDFEMFEEEGTEEQDHSEIPFNASDQDNAQIDHFNGDRFNAPNESVMQPPIYLSFEDAVRIAREEFPTPFIAECRDLSVYLFNENGPEELPQSKKPLISAYNFYRVQSAHSRQIEWKKLTEEEMRGWIEKFNLVRMAQVAQCRANLIVYKPSVNQKRKMKKLGCSSGQ
ncbi:hypothetical protein L5515_015515 [Caenorhabditis briggsae]|uniref:Uncharacterized protein n=1 Tax=Caenorhabditis briggsae TaxID=6238 RepID=A0AAE9JA30_CAEBR|nr:hypothetical protein L5515_015515 [Caenorhabditis briggsae]